MAKRVDALSATDPLAQKAYWEEAGARGYDRQMFASTVVERHINQRLWDVAVEIGLHLGMNLQSDVLDLGCGDGSFANTVLARRFRGVDGFDFAEAAIRHAAANAPGPNTRFTACDITQLDYSQSIVTKSVRGMAIALSKGSPFPIFAKGNACHET